MIGRWSDLTTVLNKLNVLLQSESCVITLWQGLSEEASPLACRPVLVTPNNPQIHQRLKGVRNSQPANILIDPFLARRSIRTPLPHTPKQARPQRLSLAFFHIMVLTLRRLQPLFPSMQRVRICIYIRCAVSRVCTCDAYMTQSKIKSISSITLASPSSCFAMLPLQLHRLDLQSCSQPKPSKYPDKFYLSFLDLFRPCNLHPPQNQTALTHKVGQFSGLISYRKVNNTSTKMHEQVLIHVLFRAESLQVFIHPTDDFSG